MIRLILACALTPFVLCANASEYAEHACLPDDEHATARAAIADFGAQRYDVAAAKFHEILAKHPDCLYAWSNLGVTRSEQGRFAEAKSAFESALRLQPNDVFCLTGLGLVDFKLGRFNDAIAKLKMAITLKPDDAQTHDDLVAAYAKAGRKQEAELEFSKAREIEGNRVFICPVDHWYPPIASAQ
jgi:Flp pilus assembly protein TadD